MISDQIIHLLCESFGDSESYIRSLISSGFLNEDGLFTEVSGGEPVSVLFAKQFPINIGTEKCFADYLFYVATAEKMRGRGLASDLIRRTLAELSCKGSRLAVLIPASENLFGFYKKLGFSTDFYISRRTYAPGGSASDEIRETNICKADSLYNIYAARFSVMPDTLYKSRESFLQACAEAEISEEEKILTDGKELAFAVFGDEITLREYTGTDEKRFALSVANKYGCSVTVEAPPAEDPQPLGMAYWYGERPKGLSQLNMNNLLN